MPDLGPNESLDIRPDCSGPVQLGQAAQKVRDWEAWRDAKQRNWQSWRDEKERSWQTWHDAKERERAHYNDWDPRSIWIRTELAAAQPDYQLRRVDHARHQSIFDHRRRDPYFSSSLI